MIADSKSRHSNVDLALVYDHLAFSEYQLGNIKKAAQYTRDLLQNGRHSLSLCYLEDTLCCLEDTLCFFFLLLHYAEPNHERALSNLAYFEGLRTNGTDKFTDAETDNDSGEESYTEREVYETTCREGRSMVSCVCQQKCCCFVFASLIMSVNCIDQRYCTF